MWSLVPPSRVDAVSLEVEIGAHDNPYRPKGAGKSNLIRLMSGEANSMAFKFVEQVGSTI